MARGTAVSVQPGANSSGRHVNDRCHGRPGKLDPRQRHIMEHPRVYAIYWDEYFTATPAAVDRMNAFFHFILGSSFMDALAQYGVVKPGTFVGHTVVTPSPPPPPPPILRHPPQVEAELKGWLDKGLPTVRPEQDTTDLLYVIFSPHRTNIGTGISGYHDNGYYQKTNGNVNLFWAVIQEWHAKGLPASAKALADACTWCVSHEMVEAFTDRDDHGFRNERGCEIGDICEVDRRASDEDEVKINTRKVGEWTVEPYWDAANGRCYPS
jgi:hypothetical protein